MGQTDGQPHPSRPSLLEAHGLGLSRHQPGLVWAYAFGPDGAREVSAAQIAEALATAGAAPPTEALTAAPAPAAAPPAASTAAPADGTPQAATDTPTAVSGAAAPGAPADRPPPASWWWLHFDLADQRTPATARRLVEAASAPGPGSWPGSGPWAAAPTRQPPLPPGVLEAFARSGPGLELHYTQGWVHGRLADRVIDLAHRHAEPAHAHLLLGPHLLLTGRRHHLHGIEAARQEAREGRSFAVTDIGTAAGTDLGSGSQPMRLLEFLVQQGTQAHGRTLDLLSDTLDQIEDQVLTESNAIDRSRIVRIRHVLVRLHRELAGQLRLFKRADQEVREESSAAAQAHAQLARSRSGSAQDWADFGPLLQHLHSLDDQCQSLIDRARLLQDEASDQLAAQTNRQLYVLSILTAALVPPTIVVGIFGMNTGGLPLTQNPNGFVEALLLCAGSSLAVLGVLALLGLIHRPKLPRWWRQRSAAHGAGTPPADDLSAALADSRSWAARRGGPADHGSWGYWAATVRMDTRDRE